MQIQIHAHASLRLPVMGVYDGSSWAGHGQRVLSNDHIQAATSALLFKEHFCHFRLKRIFILVKFHPHDSGHPFNCRQTDLYL